jgi:hypothetical protein
MEANFRLLWKALVNAYDAGWELVQINLLWFVLTIPIITIFSILVELGLSILAPILAIALPLPMAGLAYYMHEAAHSESVGWKDFFFGMKKYFWPSMRYLLLNLFIFFLLVFYQIYFSALNNNFTPYIIGLIYGVGIIWLLLMPFVFPLMLEQKKPGLRDALRNSLVMYLKWPGITLPVVILVYILVIGSFYILVPWGIITASLCSFLLAYIAMVKAEESAQQERAKEAKGTEEE